MYRCRQILARCSSSLEASAKNVVSRQTARNGERWSSGYGGHQVKQSTMNDMPVPSGSWAKSYSRAQTKNNMILLGGIGFLGATIFVGIQTDSFYLNWEPENLKKTKLNNIMTHEMVRQKADIKGDDDQVPAEVVEEAAPVEEAAAAPAAEEAPDAPVVESESVVPPPEDTVQVVEIVEVAEVVAEVVVESVEVTEPIAEAPQEKTESS